MTTTDPVSPPFAGGKGALNERLKVLMDVTLLRASSISKPTMPARGVKAAWGLEPDAFDVQVTLAGLAEAQFETECDECGSLLPKGQRVAGKVITWATGTVLCSAFSPTCIGCFVQDRGGYLSLGVVYLVTES
jgi:hypothetical protein